MATGAGFEHASERMKENLAKALEKPTSLAYAVSAEIQVREGRYEEAFAAIFPNSETVKPLEGIVRS